MTAYSNSLSPATCLSSLSSCSQMNVVLHTQIRSSLQDNITFSNHHCSRPPIGNTVFDPLMHSSIFVQGRFTPKIAPSWSGHRPMAVAT